MKITTLVPAYKPHYLFDLLHALRFQTVKPHRVIISDDGPDQAFIHQLRDPALQSAVADLRIETMVGPHQGSGWANMMQMLRVWEGDTELFHVLLDDDYIYPDFYERHLVAHASGDFNCSVSRRWTARETGQPLEDLPMPQVIASHPHRLISLDPQVLFSHTVGQSRNWLGEFSNAVFRTSSRHQMDGFIAGISYRGLEDLGSFLKASTDKPLAFINERLGYFRKHGNQNSAQPLGRPMKMAFVGYIALGIAAHRIGRLTDAQLTQQLADACPAILRYYHAQADLADICRVMPALATRAPGSEEAFLQAWERYVNQG